MNILLKLFSTYPISIVRFAKKDENDIFMLIVENEYQNNQQNFYIWNIGEVNYKTTSKFYSCADCFAEKQ